jgi:hypothetical protein
MIDQRRHCKHFFDHEYKNININLLRSNSALLQGSDDSDLLSQTESQEYRPRTELGNFILLDLLLLNYITASGSIFHQLLAASRRRRKSPNLPKGLEPPANQVSNKGAPF